MPYRLTFFLFIIKLSPFNGHFNNNCVYNISGLLKNLNQKESSTNGNVPNGSGHTHKHDSKNKSSSSSTTHTANEDDNKGPDYTPEQLAEVQR